jgi:hypothetical protein
VSLSIISPAVTLGSYSSRQNNIPIGRALGLAKVEHISINFYNACKAQWAAAIMPRVAEAGF